MRFAFQEAEAKLRKIEKENYLSSTYTVLFTTPKAPHNASAQVRCCFPV